MQDPHQQAPLDAPAEDVTVNLSEVEVASDEASSVSSAESSTESTLTPASSYEDLLDTTLVSKESPGNYLQGSLSRSSLTNEDLFDVLGEIEQTVKMTSEGRREILGKISLLIENLNDYIDENSMNALNLSIEDIDTNIQKAESMRLEFRELHQKLQDTVGETEYKEKHAENEAEI